MIKSLNTFCTFLILLFIAIIIKMTLCWSLSSVNRELMEAQIVEVLASQITYSVIPNYCVLGSLDSCVDNGTQYGYCLIDRSSALFP
jgi:uncharacterized Tic20 family protein